MDAESKVISNSTVDSEYSDNCILYRMVHDKLFKKDLRKPSSSMFDPEQSGLSTDWNKYSNPEVSLIRTGLTYKYGSTNYKDQNKFFIIQLIVGELRKIEEINGIEHTPDVNDPEIVGSPNNNSHTSVFYIDEEIRLKLVSLSLEVTGINREYVNSIVELRRLETGSDSSNS